MREGKRGKCIGFRVLSRETNGRDGTQNWREG
jgi:hypothetical protein